MAWVGDGSDDTGTTFTQTGNNLVITGSDDPLQFNLRLDHSEQASCTQDYYWQATIQELKGHLSFGAVSEDGINPGYKIKGMFYNGNLTNGSYCSLRENWGPSLRDRWGPSFQTGDVIGVVGSASLCVEAPETSPSTELSTPNVTGFYGNWKLDKAWNGKNQLKIPRDYLCRPILLELINEGSNKEIKIYFDISNTISGTASILQQNETTIKVDCGPGFVSTRALPLNPVIRSLEDLLTAKNITTITLDKDNGMLTVTGPEMKTEWSRLIRIPEAFTKF
ncbi:expressed unknown protein [Seminavis robusta]|uniref:Uncharacterized protein n=1 Tax=Seminavis robusta TaxID=568900 RepID=A0A9N8DWW1_9STRA|nr:expressed unknown protein [Seminavis robusta]|eukprot:Sro437_g142750.1 n/a (279) ;mRNA; r:7778-8733